MNLTTNNIIHIHRFSEDIAGPTSFLNDLRIDNKNGFIYITDSGIYVNPD